MVYESIVNGSGHAVDAGVVGIFDNLSTAVGPGGVSIPGVGSCVSVTPGAAPVGKAAASGSGIGNAVAQCVNQLHLSNVVTYQPANRYWPFQTYETLIFLALAAAAGAFTVWWVRRLN